MFKKFLMALSVTTALCIPEFAQAEMIADTVAQALVTHPDMKAGQAAMAAAENGVKEQRSGYFPVVGIDGSGGRLRNNDETTRGATPGNGAASSWMGQGTVRLTQPLFDGFGVWNRVEGARDRASAANYELVGTAEDVALRAARAHLNLMRTKELLELASKFLSDIETRRNNIDMMVKEGAADAAELLQADEIKLIAKNTKLGYEEAFRAAKADYIEVVGAEPVGALEFGEPVWNGILPSTIDDAIAYAATKNARVMAAGKMEAAMSSDAGAEKSSLMPRLDAEMSYMQKDQVDEIGGEASSAQAVVKLGWNFATGGGQIARIDKAQQQRQEAAAKKMGIMRTVERDVRQKYNSMEIVDEQYAVLAEREKAAQKIVDNFLAQYEGGKQSNLQLITANSKMFEAGASRIDSRYRQILARFELLNAMGRLHEAFGNVKIGTK